MSRPIDLFPKTEVQPVDPVEVARHSDGLEEILREGRKVEQFKDGVVLVYGLPQEPDHLTTFIAHHEQARQQAGYAIGDYVVKHIIPSPIAEVSYVAPRGQDIATSARELRQVLSTPNPTKKHASSEVLTSSAVGRYPPEHHWDSAQQANGMAMDGKWDRVLGIVNNMEFQINKYGHVINGTEDWYVTRPQPDYFAHMVELVAGEYGPQAYERYIQTLEKNYHDYWMAGADELPKDGKTYVNRAVVRMPDGALLNRYVDDMKDKRGRVPARYESYAEDWETVEKAIAEIEKGKGRPLTEQEREKVQDEVFGHLRGGAASGWDFTSRWLSDGKNLHTIKTNDILPVDLNSLLYYHEVTIASAYRSMGESNSSRRLEYERRAAFYQERANDRAEAITKYMWNPKEGRYHDYDFVDQKQTPIVSAATVYPLFVGAANGEQAAGVMDTVRDQLLFPGGLASSTVHDSGQQWDSLNGWAPPNHAGAKGFALMGHLAAMGKINLSQNNREWAFRTSEDIRDGYRWANDVIMQREGIFAEKVNVLRPDVPAGGGEYERVPGLGMAAELNLFFGEYEPRDPKSHIGKSAVAFWTP